jgi:hypothetical protein
LAAGGTKTAFVQSDEEGGRVEISLTKPVLQLASVE